MVAEKTAKNFGGYFILPHPVCTKFEVSISNQCTQEALRIHRGTARCTTNIKYRTWKGLQ